MKLTVCYITARHDPHIEWALADLAAQRKPGDNISLVAIDFFGRSQSELGIRPEHALERTIIAKPKPNIWGGEYRVTRDHWWHKSAAANTALVLAPTDYVVFLDDRCHLAPTWLDAVRAGYNDRTSVLLGTYEKLEDHHVGNEREPIGRDGRLSHSPHGMRGCPGGWLYGCCFALPLAWALEVGGFEEALDGMSFEDCIFGMMLSNAGRRCDFVPGLRVIQDRTGGKTNVHRASFKRTDKGPEPADLTNPSRPWDKTHESIARFGSRSHTDPAYTDDPLKLRELIRAGGPFPLPDPTRDYRDWYDCPCGCSPLVRDTKMHSYVSGTKNRSADDAHDRALGDDQKGMPWRSDDV